MDINYPKFQFEVRYTNILNFSLTARNVVSPFLKLAKSFNIFNQGMLEEQIKLNFDDDAFAIDLRWDRIILIAEKDISRFSDNNSPVKTFFQILDKLSKESSFGVITNYLFWVTLVKIMPENYSAILANFKKNNLNPNVDIFIQDPDDISIVLEKKDGQKLTSIAIGPFSQTDIINRGLIPFKSPELQGLINSVGLIMELKIFESSSSVDFTIFKELIRLTTNQYSKLL